MVFFQLRYELFKLWCPIIGALFANIKEIFIFTNENENFDDEWETRIVLIVEELRIGKKWLRADTGPAASTGRICGGN